jgi:hypothetical protein
VIAIKPHPDAEPASFSKPPDFLLDYWHPKFT